MLYFLKKIFKRKNKGQDEFIVWIKNNKDGKEFTHLLGIDTEIRKFIDSHMPWVFSNKNMILTALDLYESAKMLLEIKEISIQEFEDLKSEMKRINFKSMAINW